MIRPERRALESFEKVLGPNHPDKLTCVNNLASLLYAQGKLHDAEPLFRRSLEGHKENVRRITQTH